MKKCLWCGKELSLMQSELKEGRKSTKKNFCNHWCSAQWRNKDKREKLECASCGKSFIAQKSAIGRKYCSNACYLKEHATKLKTCLTCGKEFKSYQSNQKYCSTQCVPRKGKLNPNFGNRYSGKWACPVSVRNKLSENRKGDKNPNWVDGKKAGKYKFQTYLYNWMTEKHKHCSICKSTESLCVHHCLPRRKFKEPIQSNFYQNLIVVCRKCHPTLDYRFRKAEKSNNILSAPFVNRLPKSILHQLETDDLVSKLPRECDFSPIGMSTSEVLRSVDGFDKAA